MKTLTKVALSALSLASVAAISVAGTVAYLTDRENATNLFTTGDVEIRLNEDFLQGSTLIPGVDINKDVSITNVGDVDAWVWYTYAVPTALVDTGNNAGKNAIHFNLEGAYWDAYYTQEEYYTAAGLTAPVSLEETWHWSDIEHNVAIDDSNVPYTVVTVCYNGVLAAGDTTGVSLTNVYLDARVDIDPDGNMYWVENGVATDLNWNTETDGAPKIYVNAYAIQADEFGSVDAAYKAYGVQWGENGNAEVEAVASAASEAELAAAAGNVVINKDIELTEDVTALNNAATIVLDGSAITADRSDSTAADKFSALTVYNDVTIGGTGTIENKSGYTISVRDENATLTIDGGTYKGVTSAVNVVKGNLVINGGHFEVGENSYGATYLINCIDANYKNGTATVTITGGTFVNFNPADNEAEPGDHINFVADGYKVVEETQANGDVWYTVVAE